MAASTNRRKSAAKKSTKEKEPPAPLIRTSERSLWKTCRWSWQRAYIDHLKPINEKPALRFGTLVHGALEKRYPPGIKRGPHPAKTFEKLYEDSLTEAESEYGSQIRTDEDWEDAGELGVAMLNNFVDTYGRDEEWKVLGSEMTFRTPVYPPEELYEESPVFTALSIPPDKPLFYYVGTMDGVWQNRQDGRVRIIDWKTTGKDPVKEAQGKGVLDEQATAYWTWGVDYLIKQKLLKPRHIESLDGMLYCFLRKAKPDERPTNADGYALNKDGTVSKQQPAPYFHRELVYRSEVERKNATTRAVQEVMEMFEARDGMLPLYKTPETGQMGHCSWCGFRDICELHEMDADWESLRDSTMTTWDPYDAHEIETEGKER